ncbi:N-acetylmuramoyl-L-alanine amidase [Pseudooceanicola sp. C21-150M6]|uniref:N-acetylmuramoyl-L-alanine amidase n=1 Tax=Pseudooceanicola sp. C21-150M6 TaxID=3434355 RepID=UPI003D7F9019
MLIWLAMTGLAGPSVAQSADPDGMPGFSALAQIDAGNSGFQDRGTELELTLALSQGVPWRVFHLDDPWRIVLDFREIDWGALTPGDLGRSPRLTDVRFGSFRPGWSRLVLTLAAPMRLSVSSMKVDPDSGAARLNVTFSPDQPDRFRATAGAPNDPRFDLPAPAATAERPPADHPLTVMIDPGHGGIDPGAVQGGLVEKELMLTLARKLRDELRRSGEARAVLTRTEDSFVPLERRVAMAHEQGADLFLSLHADFLAFGRADGAVIYTLSDTASDEASEKLAERHDRDDLLSGVDLTGKDDVVAGVLMDLARQETVPRTARLAQALATRIRASGAPLNAHALRAADFSVLKAADIPSVLIEVGFLSSAGDRANLSDPAFLDKFAQALAAAIADWHQEDLALRPLIRQ